MKRARSLTELAFGTRVGFLLALGAAAAGPGCGDGGGGGGGAGDGGAAPAAPGCRRGRRPGHGRRRQQRAGPAGADRAAAVAPAARGVGHPDDATGRAAQPEGRDRGQALLVQARQARHHRQPRRGAELLHRRRIRATRAAVAGQTVSARGAVAHPHRPGQARAHRHLDQPGGDAEPDRDRHQPLQRHHPGRHHQAAAAGQGGSRHHLRRHRRVQQEGGAIDGAAVRRAERRPRLRRTVHRRGLLGRVCRPAEPAQVHRRGDAPAGHVHHQLRARPVHAARGLLHRRSSPPRISRRCNRAAAWARTTCRCSSAP